MRLFLAPLFAFSLCAQGRFQKEVRPVLSKRCMACPGPDDHRRQTGLRLDTFESATKSSAIVPVRSAQSRLLARVTDAKCPMPPAGPRLTSTEVDALKRWIDGGARYSAHWAYEKPLRPALIA